MPSKETIHIPFNDLELDQRATQTFIMRTTGFEFDEDLGER